VSVIGSDLSTLGVMRQSLNALDAAGIHPLAMQQGTRRVEMQVMVDKAQMAETIKVLHHALIEQARDGDVAPAEPAIAAE